MNLSQVLQQRPLQPVKMYFKEIVPLCSKNRLQPQKQSGIKSACVEELQVLFACLKKWEFDDLHCEKPHLDYNRCVADGKKLDEKAKALHKEAPIGSGDSTLTTGQFNKLMEMHPQPDLGSRPYRLMKRLPTQSYADDIFHQKNKKGRPS